MTKSELIDRVTNQISGLNRDQTEIIIDTFFQTIIGSLKNDEKVELRGFGNFKLKLRNPRKARNPKTGEQVEVPSKKVIHFKAGRELRDILK